MGENCFNTKFSHNHQTPISWTSFWFAKGLSIILDQLTAHSMQKGIESNLAKENTDAFLGRTRSSADEEKTGRKPNYLGVLHH